MKRFSALSILLIYCLPGLAQLPVPSDYLSNDFHKGRRNALRKMMPANSVMAVFAFPTRNFSNDVNYKYHANPDLYYFSGYTEPNAILLIFKDEQTDSAKHKFNEVFFVQKRDADKEQWTGKRLGVAGVKEKLGFTDVYNAVDFASFKVDLSKFDKILFEFPNEVSDHADQSDDTFDLIQIFKEKTNFPENYDSEVMASVEYIRQIPNVTSPAILAKIGKYYQNMVKENERFKKSEVINKLANVKDSTELIAVLRETKDMKWNSPLFKSFTDQLRQIKTGEEMVLMRKAIDISAVAHNEAMKAVKPNMSELELQGVQEFIHKKMGAEYVGYPSIVGAGNNGCVLHYIENNVTAVGNKMVLMDVGAEYHGYSADVTRTFPANGKFTAEQKLIYNIVYEAQEAVFKVAHEGTSFQEIEKTARDFVTKGLVKLGILKDEKLNGLYYPHGCSHFLGLDVHDKGIYDKLLKDMVITVEPGIYIPEGSDCDQKWWGIAVRIEDDVLIGTNQCEILSKLAVRKVEEVEKMASQKSFVDNLILGEKK
jgi:Xaa-Pro aminopeptidase